MEKGKIKPGDILVSDNDKQAFVRRITESGIRVFIDNKKDVILNEQLFHWKLANPIIKNRLVNDYTFAVRFKEFLKWIPEDWIHSQPHHCEEYKYMLNVAERLLKYQMETATNELELDYLHRLGLYDKE